MRRQSGPSRALPLLLAAVAAAWSAPGGASPSPTAVASSVTTTAAATGWTLLPRSTHPFARPELDQGRVDPAMLLRSASFVFQPSPQQRAERDARIAAVQDPSAPLYHRWLTPEQYAARFGASPADIARVSSWLQTQGFAVESPSRTATQLFFTGSVSQVEQAFRTEMHWYLVDGERHFAMSKAPSIPSELADVIQGLHGFHSFRLHPPGHVVADPDYELGKQTTLGPADFATIYDVSPLYAAGIDGTGTTVAIAGQTEILATDYAGFRSTFGLSATEPVNILVPGSGSAYVSDPDIGEASIDTQWSGGVAKNATVEYVFTGNNPAYGVMDAYAYVVNQGIEIAPVVSVSYGSCEQGLSPADADDAQEVAAAGNLMGLTLLAAAGDSGAADCDSGSKGTTGLMVDMPASLPGVTGVGGTQFPQTVLTNTAYWSSDVAVTYPASGGVSLEQVWNNGSGGGGLGAGGGGKSIVFPKPFYQQTITPADGARDVPDVALSASDVHAPYAVYDTTDNGSRGLGGFGGTSCASPSLAGILTLVNQAIVKAGGTAGLGNVNPMLYALSQSVPTAFHDIVTGSNIVACQQGTPDCPPIAPYSYGYSAGPGYDLASGLGSVDANNLVDAWMGLTPTSTTLAVSAASTTVGTPVTLTATVASTGTVSMTGDVSFTFETYAPTGAGNTGDGPDGGLFDDSWVLGAVAVTPTTAGSATATLTVAIPPGYDGTADVVAMYSGDESYLASHSAKTRITVGGLTLAVTPLTATVHPSATVQFTASGGTPPYRYYIETDSTYYENKSTGGYTGAQVDNTGLLTAGPEDGTAVLECLDAAGATVWLTVTAAGAAVVPDEDASTAMDSGSGGDGSAVDGSASTGDASGAPEAGSPDSGMADAGSNGSSEGGCGCVVAGGDAAESRVGSLGGLLVGLVALGRRRRLERSRPAR
jgi:subtilase family serine protease